MRVGVTVHPRELVAVLVAGGEVAADTRAELGPGLRVALRRALRRLTPAGRPEVDGRPRVDAVTVDVGPMLAMALDRDGLSAARVAVLRLARPDRSIHPPLSGWPDEWREAFGLYAVTVAGGHDLFGVPLGELDRKAVTGFASRLAATGTSAVAITAAGAVLAGGHEVAAAEIVTGVAPGVAVTLSHQIGGLGLVYRENAAILNAVLRGFADGIVSACTGALRDLRLPARLGFVQGDAALASAEHWRAFPVLAIESTTAVSLAGAGALTGADDALVVIGPGRDDVVGRLADGWPVTVPRGTLPGGLVTSVRVPDVRPIPAELHGKPGPTDGAGDPLGEPIVLSDPPDAAATEAFLSTLGRGRTWRLLDRSTAAAVGAALARPAVTFERLVVATTPEQLDAELLRARRDALARLVAGGADPASAQIVDAHVTALAYLAGTVRVQVRAVGRAATPTAVTA